MLKTWKKVNLDEIDFEKHNICLDCCLYCYNFNPFIKEGKPCKHLPKDMKINLNVLSVFKCGHHRRLNAEVDILFIKKIEEMIFEKFKKFAKRKNKKWRNSNNL